MASVYDNWMRGLDREDDNPAEPQERATLLSYLNGTITTDEAAHEYGRQATESENRSAELNWSLLFDAAEEFPQAHEKLMDLLDVIVQLRAKERGAARNLRELFPYFVFELHDTFNGIQSASQSSDSTITEEHHYINLCAFISLLWHRKLGDWTNWAMELSHDGLEDDHRKPLTNLFGRAVAQLFLFSGPEMYASSNAADSSAYCAGPLLLKEREAATVSRWEFWKRRLGQLTESELLSNETAELFSRALENMAKVEAEYTIAADDGDDVAIDENCNAEPQSQ